MNKFYSLALGGGSAKGFCHIGVIKCLEDKNIQINEVSGTSMGSIIGACFSLGMNSIEIEKIAKDVNFLKLFDLDLSKGIVSGDKIHKFLDNLFQEKLIEETKIPLKIIATDLNTGEKIVFNKGKIADAVRSSISLPFIFSPFDYKDLSLVDGGLKSNLPVLELDGENIIAVSAVRKEGKKIETHKKILNIEFKRMFFSYNFDIINRLVTILMCTNEDLTLEIAKKEGKKVIFLSPNLSEFEYYDFKKIDEIILKGYEEAREKLSKDFFKDSGFVDV